MIVYLV